MSYCNNCGTKISSNSKFCPNCGNKISIQTEKSKRRSPPKRKMQKGVVKSLQDETPQVMESELKEHFFSDIQNNVEEKLSKFTDHNFDGEDDFYEDEIEEKSLKNTKSYKTTLIWIYAILNMSLLSFSNVNEMILGYMFYTVIIIIVIFIRIKKEKTFNWLLKILLVLQILTAMSVIVMSNMEYMFEQPVFVSSILIGLLITKLLMLIKGNSK